VHTTKVNPSLLRFRGVNPQKPTVSKKVNPKYIRFAVQVNPEN